MELPDVAAWGGRLHRTHVHWFFDSDLFIPILGIGLAPKASSRLANNPRVLPCTLPCTLPYTYPSSLLSAAVLLTLRLLALTARAGRVVYSCNGETIVEVCNNLIEVAAASKKR